LKNFILRNIILSLSLSSSSTLYGYPSISVTRDASDRAQVSAVMCQTRVSKLKKKRASEIARCSFPRDQLAVNV